MKHFAISLLWIVLALCLLLTAVGCTPTPSDPESDTPSPEEEQPPAPDEEEKPAPQDPKPTIEKGEEPSDAISAKGDLWVSMSPLASVKNFYDDNNVNCRVVQGGCTDGTYWYIALNDGKSSDANSVSAVRKYEIATGKLVATFEGLHVAHCNDMTYNPDTNEILAVHNAPERKVISVFDADSFTFKRKITLALDIYSISFDPYEQCYWVGISYGYNFAKLDLNFKQVGKVYTGQNTGFTKQGMDVDSKYIYFLQYKTNCIVVYDKSGSFIRQIDLPQTSYEAENICHVGNVFYISYYQSPGGGTLYKTTVTPRPKTTVTVDMTLYKTLPQYTDGSDNLCKVVQGSCTNGTYLYQAMNNDLADGYVSALHKIDLGTGEIVATKEGLQTGSANDMTYNGRANQIVVAHNKGGGALVSLFNADTLELIETITLPFNIYCIAYDGIKNGYWVGISGGYDFALLDANFQQTGTIYTGYNTGYTKQSLDCDGEYLYFLHSATNSVVIYQTDGTYVGCYTLPESNNSAQSICHAGTTFYVGYNVSDDGGMIYTTKIDIKS
ncbi:MAG: hypothetical protein IJY50_02855 [Clostridia bacterium]|nr:hypothetical protein [Clostridia bacterium]